jgi:hypothetical protein
LCDRGSPGYQRSFIGESLRQIGVILLHDIEHRLLGKAAVMVGQEFVQVSEFVVIHSYRASAAMAGLYCKLLILHQLFQRRAARRSQSRRQAAKRPLLTTY